MDNSSLIDLPDRDSGSENPNESAPSVRGPAEHDLTIVDLELLEARSGDVSIGGASTESDTTTAVMPVLRLYGWVLLSLVIFLHNRFVLEKFSWNSWAGITLILAAYGILSWIGWRRGLMSDGPTGAGLVLLSLDLAFCTAVVYLTGATASLLFFLLLVPACGQISIGVRRALLAGLAGTGCYVLVDVLVAGRGGLVSPSAELVKLVLLLAGSAYLAIVAVRVERRAGNESNAPGAVSLVGILRQKIRELEQSRRRAEESNEAKNEYLANISHEIRTPLGGIIGMTHLALASELTQEQRSCIESAHSSAKSLMRVINDILDYSKIEARKLELQANHFDLHDRIAEVVKSFGVAAHKKGLELGLQILPGVPHNVVGDDGRMRQVLVNLIGNAVKFTDRGEVFVTVEVSSRTKQDVMIRVSVRDTGPGVEEKHWRSIFGAFEQADDTISRRYGGTGLGLSISARLVELMGGKIWLESVPGAGSTFHFTARLWLQRVATLDARPILPVSAQRRRVLVVEDNPSTASMICSVLEGWDLEPVWIPDGEIALALTSEEEQHFAFVLIDAGREGGGGLKLAEAISRNPRLPGSVVMMLPSPGDFQGAASCRQLGLSGYVTKPFSAAELADAISRALHAPLPLIQPSPRSENEADRAGKKLAVLVVEDDPVNRELAAALLRRRGHEADLVSDGEEALALLRRRRFDLILMDVQMPGLDGIRTTQAIRAAESEPGEHLPIIGLSAHAGQSDRERCLEAGMDGYVVKPLTGPELYKAIERILPIAPYPDRPVESEPDAFLIDPRELLARVDGNRKLARRITRLFIEEAPKMIGELEDAIEARDAGKVCGTAHRLKGAISNFPAAEPLASAARLEMIGRRDDLDGAEAAFARLQEDVHDLILALEIAAEGLHEQQGRD